MTPTSYLTTRTWAVPKSGLDYAWFRYTRRRPPPTAGDEDYLSWCAFQTAYVYGWLDARGLSPDYNRVEMV